MRNFLKLCSVVSLFAVTFALFPVALHAQRWVYVNDNNSTTNANTVTGFSNVPAATLTLIPGTPWATGGTGRGNYFALQNQALYTLGTPAGTACLFISDPSPGTGFPNGDIAVFTVNTVTGALVQAAPFRYVSPNGFSGNAVGIPLATGGKTLYAGWTLSKWIEVWAIGVTTNPFNCKLTYRHKVAAAGVAGGRIDGMRESPNFKTLVVAYGDGSIESFTTVGYGITKTPCAVPINSTGFVDGNNGYPAGVDIAKDSQYAVFGDSTPSGTNVTELETARLPITCATLTKDFGGPIVASGTNLGPGKVSNNVWLSPDGSFIYVANNDSGQVTTIDYNEGANTMALAGAAPPLCKALHTNPTLLKGYFNPWSYDVGIQTSLTSGTGTRLYVAEYGSPSSVALLKVDAAGCTEEEPGSPFADINSNSGAMSLNAWPPRPF
jgi:hypothetical protein